MGWGLGAGDLCTGRWVGGWELAICVQVCGLGVASSTGIPTVCMEPHIILISRNPIAKSIHNVLTQQLLSTCI